MQEIESNISYEVIVVDNNSQDQTKEVILEHIPKFQNNLKYMLEMKQGKSYAMNTAIKESRGKILCFTDDDVIVDKIWLQKTLECFKNTNCSGVGGKVIPIYQPNTPSWIQKYAIKLSGAVVIYDLGDKTLQLKNDQYRFIGANFSFKRELFDEAGFFRTDRGPGTDVMGEDTDFIDRLLSLNKTLYYSPEAIVWHPFDPKRLSLKHLAQWNIQFGRFAAQRQIATGEKITCCFGVPRYLIRGIILNFIRFILLCWHTPSRFIAWRNFFAKFGMIEEYRRIYLQKKVQHA